MEKRTLNRDELIDWIRLIRSQNVGPIIFRQLIARFGTASQALAALPDLAKKGGMRRSPRIATRAAAVKEMEHVAALGGQTLALCDPAYPPLLAAAPDSPPVLTYKGHLHLSERPCLGVVGARSSSLNGESLTETLSRQLGERGWTIVSGLARGIDTAAHRGSLPTGTIAVVAGGLDVVYPEENRDMMAQIAEAGVVVAESPPGTKPTAQHFPRRNRIIAGLCLGTLVVEARIRSGALITARMAADYGREVMAIPGSPLDPRAGGPNKLIKDGAHLIQSVDDVLQALSDIARRPLEERDDLPLFASPATEQPDPDLVDRARSEILEKLSVTPLAVDELIRRCHFSQAVVSTVLMEAELAGVLDRHPGNRVSLKARALDD